jgi:uncharacterized protein DUF3558
VEREIVRRSVLLMSALALVLAGTSACSDKTTGSAVPGGSTGEQTGSSTTTTSKGSSSSRPTTGGTPLAGKDPCSLLTANAKAELGLSGDGEKSNAGSARGCKWQRRDVSGDLHIFSVDINEHLGVKDLPASAKQLADIDGHKAAQTSGIGGPGSCTVTTGVTDKSRVDSSVLAGTNTQKSCDLALQVAKLVEPELS